MDLPIWNDTRKYYKAFSKGKDIHLFYKDDGIRKTEIIKSFPYYFLITKQDYVLHKSFLEEGVRRKRILKIGKHITKDWVRIYVNKIYRRDDAFNSYLESGEWNRLCNIDTLVALFARKNIKTYDADLTPLHRFLADYEIQIDMDLSIFYFDFETDDTNRGFSDHSMSMNRILSFSYYDNFGDNGFDILKKESDYCERNLILRFLKCASKYDIISAWNGWNFDYKVARYRASKLDVLGYNKFEHKVLHSDLLQCTKRMTRSGEESIRSYALGDIGEVLLGLKKIDLNKKRMIDIYRNDKPLLERYNRRDTEIMFELDKKHGFLKSDIELAGYGNRFANYYDISTRIDGAILKESNMNNMHYETVTIVEKQKYPGGFVKCPAIGLFKDVGVFDFKGLYPGIINAFNLSHDTCLNLTDDVSTVLENNIITTPATKKNGCVFRKDKIGLIPKILKNVEKNRTHYKKLRDSTIYDSKEYKFYELKIFVCKTFILSFYGEFGNYRSRYYNRAIAETITLTGQFFIKLTMAFAKKNNYDPKYGDTDSVFIQLKFDEVDLFLKMVAIVYTKCIKQFNAVPGYIILEFDNYFKLLLMSVKKRYFGKLVYYKGRRVDRKEPYVRGFEIRKKDTIEIARRFQKKIMQMIIDECNLEDLCKIVAGMKQAVLSDRIDTRHLIIHEFVNKPFSEYMKPIIDSKTKFPKRKKDGSLYKKTMPVHVKIAKQMLKDGLEFYIGMQVPYIITKSTPRIAGVHIDAYTNNYDRKYYWNTKMYAPVERILAVAYPDDNWIKYRID